jgi:hypothetical protein
MLPTEQLWEAAMLKAFDKGGLVYRLAWHGVPEYESRPSTTPRATETIACAMMNLFLYAFGFGVWLLGFFAFCTVLAVLLQFTSAYDPTSGVLTAPEWTVVAAPVIYVGATILWWRVRKAEESEADTGAT